MTMPTRRIIVASGALLAAAPFAAARGFCDFAEFHPDPTGNIPCDAAFAAWLRAAIVRGQVARAGPGTFRLATTQHLRFIAERLDIQGAGAGKTVFRRAPRTVTRNGECLMRFVGAGAGAIVTMAGMTVDMDCTHQPNPPGAAALTGNFAWQHSIAVEFLPQAAHAFALIRVTDCEVLDPVSDGFSIRGGPAPGVDDAVFERVANPTWPIERQRPRVRGDITVTAYVRRLTVTDCVLPRLHYEVEGAMPPGFTMTVNERDNRVGELLAHFAGNYGSPDRAIRIVRGGVVARSVFQGNCITRITGGAFRLRMPSRLTGGDHRFEKCDFLIATDYTAPAGVNAAIYSSFPVARTIEMIGGTLAAAPGARTPRFLFNRNGKGAPPGAITIDGLKNRTAMQLATGEQTRITLRNM